MMVRTIFMSVLPVLVVGVAFVQSACVPLLVTGAVVGTAAVVTDRRTTGAQLDDEMIEDKNSLAIHERFRGGEFHINVTSYNGIVLLTGEVPTDSAKTDVEQMLRSTPKVRAVQDELVVGPATSLESRSNDTLITSKVKARFIEAAKFQINVVKVVTERGVVYLMGVVRHDEGAAAAEIARTTSGAQRVVKVFEYID
ncbi:MAG: BON domain-containing protein [Betaproteobacteria bacterium]|nr:MAG: BON domain-containing protein [Betaproteobacteria bacterium]